MAGPPALNESAVSCFAQGTQGSMSDCVLQATFSAGPSPALIGLGIGGVLMTSFYIAGDRSVLVPAVLLILFGSILIGMLPAQFVSLAYTLVVIGIAAAVFSAWTKYTGPGGF
jgi:hypothetical protein